MREPERAILVRMVVLAVLALTLFSGYAAFRRLAVPPPEARSHVDAQRVAQLHALLHAIEPAAAGANADAAACPGLASSRQWQDDVAELDRRLADLAAGTAPFLDRHYRLNAGAWLGRAATLPGGCAGAARTLGALLWVDRDRRLERQLLTRLEWRDQASSPDREPAVHVTLPLERFALANPWRSPAGCVLLTEHGHGRAEPQAPNRVVQSAGFGWLAACQALVAKNSGAAASPAANTLDAGSRAVPRDLALLAADLDAWRDPESRVYRTLVGESNRLRLDGGRAKAVGLHALMSFDPAVQRIAQGIAECYAGAAAACQDMGIADPGLGMLEGARVRQVGIAVIDVASGEVRAAASAESPCFRHDLSGLGARPRGCPDFGAAARRHYRQDADALRNHALFTVAPPGSTVKPIMAAGFLRDPGFARSDAEFTDRIKRSQSRIFLDWMFCRAGDGRGAFAAPCARPGLIQSAAHALGWNSGCDAGTDCGRLDLLFGRPVSAVPAGFPAADRSRRASPRFNPRFTPNSRPVVLGRVLVTEHGERLADMSAAELAPTPARLAACAAASWNGGARACRRPGLAAVSEGYGQGSAGATAVGVAGLMAQLAASAEQGGATRYPHVVRGLLAADGAPDPAGEPGRWGTPIRPAGIDAARARRILAALETTHRPGGTASGGCRKVLGQDCGELGVAAKTGTTSFGAAYTRLAGFQQAWRDYAAALDAYRSCAAGGDALRCGAPEAPPPRPWRWYAGVYKSDLAAGYDQAFAVLVERNWTAAGSIDQIGGEGVNSAAIEIGWHLVAAVRKAAE